MNVYIGVNWSMLRLLYRGLSFFALLLLVACNQYVEVADQNGHMVDLKNHPGKWLILNYWAPWCEPCKHELPEINHFYLTHQSHVVLYGIDYDHPAVSQLQNLAKRMGIDYPLLAQDPAVKLHLPDIQGLPMTFIYDPQGKLVKTLTGPQTYQSLAALID